MALKIEDMQLVEDAFKIEHGPTVDPNAYFVGFREQLYLEAKKTNNEALMTFAKSLGKDKPFIHRKEPGIKSFESFIDNLGDNKNIMSAIDRIYGLYSIEDMLRVEEALGIEHGAVVEPEAYFVGFREAVQEKAKVDTRLKAFAELLGETSEDPNNTTIDDSRDDGPENFKAFMKGKENLSEGALLKTIKTSGHNVSPRSVNNLFSNNNCEPDKGPNKKELGNK
ncbi:MAG: hypothetical protein P8L77_02595 [Gammaproteobacteria bacterium]|nr:hypothetical protein [Gammaproteobacteria bacterium]